MSTTKAKIAEILAGAQIGKDASGNLVILNVDRINAGFERLFVPRDEIKHCPTCTYKSLTSEIYVREVRPITTNEELNFFDVKGHKHRHNINTVKNFYECTNGHKWEESRKLLCWCGHE